MHEESFARTLMRDRSPLSYIAITDREDRATRRRYPEPIDFTLVLRLPWSRRDYRARISRGTRLAVSERAHPSFFAFQIVVPRGAMHAKGLLLSCIDEPDPCIIFEPKTLYRTAIDEVPLEHYKIEIGKAEIVRRGEF